MGVYFEYSNNFFDVSFDKLIYILYFNLFLIFQFDINILIYSDILLLSYYFNL